MKSVLQEAPDWWKSELSDIEAAVASVKKGKVSIIGQSAGGRNIYLFEYGKRSEYLRTANYSASLGCYKPETYKQNKHPHIMIVTGEHGAEWEGIVSGLNLVQIFETGKDYAGMAYPELATMPERAYIALILTANPDGRARVKYKTVVGMDRISFRKEDQGIWNNGEYCEWPDVKAVHPIKGMVQKLGGYFNDDGVNIVHDNFANPMAEETRVLLKTVSDIGPDIVVDMHGHGHLGGGHLIPSPHQCTECYQACYDFSVKWANNMNKYGYQAKTIEMEIDRLKIPSFNLQDAIHVTCGAMVMVYESDQGVLLQREDESRLQNRHEKIYEKHLIFYRTVDEFMQERYYAKGKSNIL